jgi:hypothetical protein
MTLADDKEPKDSNTNRYTSRLCACFLTSQMDPSLDALNGHTSSAQSDMSLPTMSVSMKFTSRLTKAKKG